MLHVNLPELTEHAAGVERYNILQENYAKGDSMVGMRNLMARVKYSNALTFAKIIGITLATIYAAQQTNHSGTPLITQFMISRTAY